MVGNWCPTCRGFHPPDDHYPRWYVYCLDWGEEGDVRPRGIPAISFEQAAERWGEELDAENIESVMGGVALVVEAEDGEKKKVSLWGEATVTWYSEVEE